MEEYLSLKSISLLGLFGTVLTIFYKKDFTFRGHVGHLKTGFNLLAVWAFSLLCERTFIAPVFTLVYVVREMQDLAIEEKIKSFVLSTAAFLCTILSGDILDCLAVLCAMTQLLRWPTDLKNHLREVRIIFGPVYPILVLGGCIQLGFTSHLLKLSSCSTLVAGIFLRPDNNEVLKFVEAVGLSVPSPKARKLTHGLLMFVSLVCIMVHLTMSPDIHRVILTGVMFVGGLGVLLYAFAAELPRKICRNCAWPQWTTTERKATSCTGLKPCINRTSCTQALS